MAKVNDLFTKGNVTTVEVNDSFSASFVRFSKGNVPKKGGNVLMTLEAVLLPEGIVLLS